MSSDVQIVAAAITTSLPIDNVLHQLQVKKHTVKGDGSCLYHAISHQGGFISNNSQVNESFSQQLRKLAVNIMQKYPITLNLLYALYILTYLAILKWNC